MPPRMAKFFIPVIIQCLLQSLQQGSFEDFKEEIGKFFRVTFSYSLQIFKYKLFSTQIFCNIIDI
jgi:hypothetical protein